MDGNPFRQETTGVPEHPELGAEGYPPQSPPLSEFISFSSIHFATLHKQPMPMPLVYLVRSDSVGASKSPINGYVCVSVARQEVTAKIGTKGPSKSKKKVMLATQTPTKRKSMKIFENTFQELLQFMYIPQTTTTGWSSDFLTPSPRSPSSHPPGWDSCCPSPPAAGRVVGQVGQVGLPLTSSEA